jgi:hypothetical protein
MLGLLAACSVPGADAGVDVVDGVLRLYSEQDAHPAETSRYLLPVNWSSQPDPA